MTKVHRRGRGEQADRSAGGECSRPGSVDTARRRSLIRLGVLVLFGALVAGAVVLVRQATAPAWPPRDWSLVVCDVGQGDALLLRTGPTSAIAVDTGPEPDREDACLRRFAINDIPLVILTHFHEDHIGGLTGLLAGRKVGAIETTIVDDPPAGARQVRTEAAAAGVPVRRVQPFERGRIGRVAWHALWPDPEDLPSVIGPPKQGDEREEPMNGMNGMNGMGATGGTDDMGGMDGMAGMGGTGGMGGEGSGPNNSSIVLAVSIDPDSATTIPSAATTPSATTTPSVVTTPSAVATSVSTAFSTAFSTVTFTPASTEAFATSALALATGPSAPATTVVTPASDGPLTALLTGDIESPVQQLLLSGSHRDELRAMVLKVPHHGSSNQAPGFVAAVDPSVAIISVGRGNPYGHPAVRALRLMGSGGARVYRTDLDGDVIIEQGFDPGQLAIRAQHGDGVPGDQAGGAGDPGPGASPTRRHSSGKSHARHQPKSD